MFVRLIVISTHFLIAPLIAQEISIRDSGAERESSIAVLYSKAFSKESQDGAKEMARSLTKADSIQLRLEALWGKFLYDEQNEESRKLIRLAIRDNITAAFPNAPKWWLEALMNCKLDKSNCLQLEFAESESQIAIVNLQQLGKFNIPKGNGAFIAVPVSDFSQGKMDQLVESVIQKHSGIEEVFVCTFTRNEGDQARLWSFSEEGKLQWMQAIDFSGRYDALANICGNSTKCRIQLVDSPDVKKNGSITGFNVLLFGAWSNCLLIARFSSGDGRCNFLFDTASFPVDLDRIVDSERNCFSERSDAQK